MQKVYTDMMGRSVEISYPPKRIISVVPSQTELLYDLGLDEEVVGITKFCIHPDSWFRSKKRVGGTKNIHLDIVQSLNPDLIIANKEENTREQIEALAALYPVWISDIQTVDDGLAMIKAVGELAGKEEKARSLVHNISNGFATMSKAAKARRVAYFIWRNPWMSVGGDTFINDIIEKMGWINVLADMQRYPSITLEDFKDKQVDTVLLSSEPYPFKEQHIAEIKAILPDATVLLVDGEVFSWYGSRMQEAIHYLPQLMVHL